MGASSDWRLRLASMTIGSEQLVLSRSSAHRPVTSGQGNPDSRHFCTIASQDPNVASLCRGFYDEKLALIRDGQQDRPSICICPMGLMILSVPVVDDANVFGAISSGPWIEEGTEGIVIDGVMNHASSEQKIPTRRRVAQDSSFQSPCVNGNPEHPVEPGEGSFGPIPGAPAYAAVPERRLVANPVDARPQPRRPIHRTPTIHQRHFGRSLWQVRATHRVRPGGTLSSNNQAGWSQRACPRDLPRQPGWPAVVDPFDARPSVRPPRLWNSSYARIHYKAVSLASMARQNSW